MDDNESEAELDTRDLVAKQNKKNKKSGGFQAMGLSNFVFNGIIKKGYRVPTPIQRKCIPIIMSGKDVVAMARTGSGKTAAFLIPMFEKLKARSATAGARALIMSPTRELALQTLKFLNELGKFSSLKAVAILGGDKMDNQFEAIHENPDVIVATPGRFLHVVMEMDLKLNMVEYVVFDEADRLFEMGFQEQLREVINRLPEARQTLLFSATLPKSLVEFAKAGLSDPVLIRLDIDTKLSDNLKLGFIGCRTEDKIAILLHLLRLIIKSGELTAIFLATKHHIEYLAMVLEKAGIAATYVYSSLDQFARKANVIAFKRKKVSVLLVTDIAARGIDIPFLDNVINFHFPAKSKLFVHRVGRVARAGRSGTAYSLVAPDEIPYLLDLHLFLGRPLKYSSDGDINRDWNGEFGCAPQSVIDDNDETLQLWHRSSIDLENMKRVCRNGYQQYLRTRTLPSNESVKRTKIQPENFKLKVHPLFGQADSDCNANEILEKMKSYKPQSTILEIGATTKTSGLSVMKMIREKHSKSIVNYQQKINDSNVVLNPITENNATDAEVESAFSAIVNPPKQQNEPFSPKKKKKPNDFKDKEYYLSNDGSSNLHFERGLEVEKTSFLQQAHGAVLDLTEDDATKLKNQANQKKWDRKKKKFVQVNGSEKKPKRIKTESGVWISASYKTNLYKDWQKKSRFANRSDDESGSDTEQHDNSNNTRKFGAKVGRNQKTKGQGGGVGGNRPPRREIKTKEEILKNRKVAARKEYLNKRKFNSKKKSHQKKGRRSGKH
ncbi:ATP-dependent RNA helicase ddx54 [Chamberlinius hualienensis]